MKGQPSPQAWFLVGTGIVLAALVIGICLLGTFVYYLPVIFPPPSISPDFWKAQLAAPPISPKGGGTISPQAWAVTLQRLSAAPNDEALRNAIHSRFPDVNVDDLVRRMLGQKKGKLI